MPAIIPILLQGLELAITEGPAVYNGIVAAINGVRSGAAWTPAQEAEFQTRWAAMVPRFKAANVDADSLFGPV